MSITSYQKRLLYLAFSYELKRVSKESITSESLYKFCTNLSSQIQDMTGEGISTEYIKDIISNVDPSSLNKHFDRIKGYSDKGITYFSSIKSISNFSFIEALLSS